METYYTIHPLIYMPFSPGVKCTHTTNFRLVQQRPERILRALTPLQHTGTHTKDEKDFSMNFDSQNNRISVRAVYECGESKDSNTLLLAAVGQRPGDAPTPDISQKAILSLPRSTQPPEPSELPALVEKTSALSKSESCSTLGAVSVEFSISNEARSMSLDLPCGLTGATTDQISPSDDTIGTSVDPPDQNISRQTSTNVDLATCLEDEGRPNVHRIDTNVLQGTSASTDETATDETATDETATDVSESALSSDPVHLNTGTEFTPALARTLENPKTSTKQEIEDEVSSRHAHSDPYTNSTHAEHGRNEISSEQATTKAVPHGVRPSKQGGQEAHKTEKPLANDGSSFTGKEVVSSVGAEAKEVLTVDQLCGQTQPVLTSAKEEGVLQTDTPPFALGKHSPSLNRGGLMEVTYGIRRNETAAIYPVSPTQRERTVSPTSRRSNRLAANFETNLSANCNATAGMSPTPKHPPKSPPQLHPNHLHATQSPNHRSTSLQSEPSPAVSPTPCPPTDKCDSSVGQTLTPAPSEPHSERIAFSGEDLGGSATQSVVTNCQRGHRGMAHAGIPGLEPPATTGNITGRLSPSAPQPTAQQDPDKHSTSSLPQTARADTGCLVGPPPANSGPAAPTP